MTGLSYFDSTDVALAEFGYELDPNGNREEVNITGSALTNGTEVYTYDTVDRLDDATYVGGGYVDFTYDANGNRTEVTTNSQTVEYEYNAADQLYAISGGGGPTVDLDYDGNGNLVTVTENSVQTRDLDWD